MTLLVISYFGGQFLLEEWKTLVVTFGVVFLLVWFFLSRGTPPKDHPLTRVVPPEHRDHPLVVNALSRFRRYLTAAAAFDVAVTAAVSVWLVKSLHYPVYLPAHLDVVKVCEVCRRAGLLCLDKLTQLEVSPELYLQLRSASLEGQNLYFEWGDFFHRFIILEGKKDYLLQRYVFLVRLILFLFLVGFFLTGWFVLSKFKRSVYLLLVPSVGQLPPPVWARLLLPVGVTLLGGYFFLQFRRSGLTWNHFLENYFFRGGSTPVGVANFFNRLGYLVGVSAVVPLLIGGVNVFFFFEYLPSHLYPELGLEGLQGGLQVVEKINLRLQHLQLHPEMYNPGEVQKLILEFKELTLRYSRFTGFINELTPRVKELYPRGYLTPSFRWGVLLLRWGWIFLVFLLILGLLFLANRADQKMTPRGGPLMFFFFEGNEVKDFLPLGGVTAFVTSVVVFVLLRRVNFPRWVHPVHYFVPPDILKISQVAHSVDRARYYEQLALSVLVGGNLGLQVCLFPLVRSCSFDFHNDWYYVTVQLKRTCLLLVDKARHPPLGPFTESFWEETYLLGCEFEILGFQFFDLFQEIHALEKPRSIFWGNIFILGVFLLVFFFFLGIFLSGAPVGVF